MMKTVHLAIDYQDFYIEGTRTSPRKKEIFRCGARAFANQLKKIDIPTIWVAFGTRKWAYYEARKISAYKRAKIVEDLNLSRRTARFLMHPFPHQDEDIFQKTDASAFSKSAPVSLKKILEARGYNHVILSGLYADDCVFRTAHDAAHHTDFHVTIARNQLMCSGLDPFDNLEAAIMNHKDMTPYARARIEMRDKGDILRDPNPQRPRPMALPKGPKHSPKFPTTPAHIPA